MKGGATRITMAVGAVLVAGGVAAGQVYSTGFEAPVFAGSAAGTALTNGVGGGGQDGWYNPVAGSTDCRVFTYAGNGYGFAPNPNPAAGAQFVAGRSMGGSGPARAQRDGAFTSGTWTAAWDVAVRYDGVLPSAPNLGSYSLQPLPGGRTWQTLYNWFNISTAATWRCPFVVYDASGLEISPPLGVLPSPAWEGLAPNTWYRISVTWSLAENRIASVSLTNLATGAVATSQPVGWYLGGGSAPALPMPASYRLFSGGAAGNIVAWDNFLLEQGFFCYADCNQVGGLTVADFACFQTKFVVGDPYADCNGFGGLTIADFACFQTLFVSGCP